MTLARGKTEPSRRASWATRSPGPAMLLSGLVGVLAPALADLRSGGLTGVGMYDDAVYFSAASGLVHGRLPYRDFLLLHPPGIVLALSPFAALGMVTTDTTGFLLARLTWLLLGGISAALVVAIIWPLGRRAALVGGVFAGTFYPAVYVSHTLLIEQLQSTLLLLTILIISRRPGRPDGSGWTRPMPWLAVGLLAGLLPTLKIWGVVPLVLIGVWVAIRAGLVRLLLVAGGALASGLAVYLPFFLQAPAAMWRYVVLDQTGRTPFSTSLVLRLGDIEGLGVLRTAPYSRPVVLLVGAAWAIALGLACRLPVGRVFAIGHASLTLFLLMTPSWLPYYPGLVAPTAGLVVGATTASVATLSRPAWRRAGVCAAGFTVIAVVVGQIPAHFGSAFPTAQLAAVRSAPGCVTADDPTTLIRLNLLDRNLDRGCPLVADLGGYTYDLLVNGQQRFRLNNPRWQAVGLAYLGSGSEAVLSRYVRKDFHSFTKKSLAVIDRWPVRTVARRWTVRVPSGH